MNYRPKNCMKCGGKKMQGGGMAAAKAHPLTRDAVNQHIFDVTGQRPDPSHPFTAMDAGLGVDAFTDILSELSGRVDRGRQNQYMYDQFSTMGQMNPMPVTDFQPNPYSLYARYGGSIRKHLKMIDKGFTNKAEMDMARTMDSDEMKKGGWISNAVNPAHKGYCTPMSKPTCTGHRRAFALMMKRKHGFHKHG